MKIYTDALFSKQKYIIRNTCAQIFTYGEGFFYVHPILFKSQAVECLNLVTREIGVPNILISDNTGEQMVPQTGQQKSMCCFHIDGRTT